MKILTKLYHDTIYVFGDLIYLLYRATIFLLISIIGGIVGAAIVVGLLRFFS